MSVPTILVVDDNQDMVSSYIDIIDIIGYNPENECNNGKDALVYYEKHKPDIVLLDVHMPKYDGFYGLQKIRELDPQAKVIFVTADHTNETKDAMTELHPTSILYKPFKINELKALLGIVLQ